VARRRVAQTSASSTVADLGMDFLCAHPKPADARALRLPARAGVLTRPPRARSTFLAAVVLVVPLFKSVKASPVLGFLLAGARPLAR